jgi:hypothetical protein
MGVSEKQRLPGEKVAFRTMRLAGRKAIGTLADGTDAVLLLRSGESTELGTDVMVRVISRRGDEGPVLVSLDTFAG